MTMNPVKKLQERVEVEEEINVFEFEVIHRVCIQIGGS